LRTIELTTLKTRRLSADVVEVYKILRGLEGTYEVKKSEEGVKDKRT